MAHHIHLRVLQVTSRVLVKNDVIARTSFFPALNAAVSSRARVQWPMRPRREADSFRGCVVYFVSSTTALSFLPRLMTTSPARVEVIYRRVLDEPSEPLYLGDRVQRPWRRVADEQRTLLGIIYPYL